MNHHRGGEGFLSSKFANTSQPIFFETNQSIRTKKNMSSNNAEAGKVDHQRFRCVNMEQTPRAVRGIAGLTTHIQQMAQ